MKVFKYVFILILAILHGCSEKENTTPPRLVCSNDWLTNPFYHTLPEIFDSSGLYKRPSYKLSKSDSSLYLYPTNTTSCQWEGGWWKLIEIADCNASKVYYPCAHEQMEESLLGFDPDKHPDLNQYYPYENFCYAITGNMAEYTYEYLNDSTIITAFCGATQVGLTPEGSALWELYLSLLRNTTLVIKKHLNLLELRTPDNVFLRFYK